MHSRAGHPNLLSILATCIYLGVKVTDGPQFARQLSSMLSHILGTKVSTDLVRAVWCSQQARVGGREGVGGNCRGAARVPCFSSLAVTGGLGQSSAEQSRGGRHCAGGGCAGGSGLPGLTMSRCCLQAGDLEIRCLKLLQWRLGPYCCGS